MSSPARVSPAPATEKPSSPASLLAIFILSPTIGTVVAAWRGLKLLITRFHERRVLEGRAIGLRHPPHPHTRLACPACGFGALRLFGDSPARETWARKARPHPLDLHCDRAGCRHVIRRATA